MEDRMHRLTLVQAVIPSDTPFDSFGVFTKMILMLPICVRDRPAAITARETVIKTSVECDRKTKKNPAIDSIIPNTVGR
jgi:hypothetical protein